MAYGEKFQLNFSDVYKNPRKLSIFQKDYSGSVINLIGTENPVVIKWHGKSDIYNPIIGSTCEINLFVTDDTQYDDWYDADEKEYKVVISTGDVSGSPTWDSISDYWQECSMNWDDGFGFEVYWEGFIIVDSYKEQYTTTPFPIRLFASDGLGLLQGFDAPYSDVVLSGSNPDTTVGSQSNSDTLFYYLRKILENTGLNFDILIANNVRKFGGNSDETIFHDILVNEFGLMKRNFKRMNAKVLLTKILELTNSRIFQSNGRWYIISNSNLIDERILDSRQIEETAIPIVQNIHITATENTQTTIQLNGFDADGFALTFAISTDVNNGSTSLTGDVVTYTPTTDFVGDDIFFFTANNGTNTSVPAFVRIKVIEAAGAALVIPYNFYNLQGSKFLYYGNTKEQALSRARAISIALSFPYTEIDYFRDETNLPSLSQYTAGQEFWISIGAGQTDSNDLDTYRLLQIGTKIVFYRANFFGNYHNPNNNTLDPPPLGTAFHYPRTPDFDNFVYPMKDGYYATRIKPIFTFDGRNLNVRAGHFDNGGGLIPLYSNLSDFPAELQSVITSPNSYYYVVVRVVNNIITERYQEAQS